MPSTEADMKRLAPERYPTFSIGSGEAIAPHGTARDWGAICKGIVDAHKRRIVVKSTQGAGTTFKVIIPVAAPGA